MPTFVLTSPDGKKYRVSGPEGTTGEQALAKLQSHLGSAAPAKPEGPSEVESGLAGAGQGVSFGFGDEMLAGLAAPVMYAGGRLAKAAGAEFPPEKDLATMSLGDIYRQERDKTRGQLKEARDANPLSYTTGYLAGAVASPVKLKGGGALEKAGRYGALAGLGESEADDAAGLLKDTAIGGGTGLVAGGVMKGAESAYKGAQNAVTGALARGSDELDDAAKAIKTTSSEAYKRMRDAGAVINRNRAVGISNQVEKALQADGKLNASLHSSTLGVLDDFKKAAKKAAKQGDFTLEELDQWRQLFGEVAGNFNDKINARKASVAIGAIDDVVNRLGRLDIVGGKTEAIDALNAGRAAWAKARKFESVADLVKKADGDANRLKNSLKAFVDNPKKMRGFSAEESAALREAARNSSAESVLKTLGKFGFDLGSSRAAGNTALPVAASFAGIAGVPGAGPLAVGGTVARQGQKLAARGKVENALRLIEDGVPRAAKGISPAVANPASRGLSAVGGSEAVAKMGGDGNAAMRKEPASGAVPATAAELSAIAPAYGVTPRGQFPGEDLSREVGPSTDLSGLRKITSIEEYNTLPPGFAFVDPYGTLRKTPGTAAFVDKPAASVELTRDPAPQSLLFDRVLQQESGGRQFDKSGNPLTSPKGAVGIAQVMPKTGPEAAKLAGLPWDAHRFKTDAEYNAALGRAYLDKQMQEFGDEALALIAYNWGPGNTRLWLKSGGKPERLPKETRNYLMAILGGNA